MPQRLAAIMAVLAFALCLGVGTLRAENTFTTTVWRAVVAMGATFVIALVVGVMGQKMMDENRHTAEEKLKNSAAKEPTNDR